MQIHSGRFKGQRIKTVKNINYRPTLSVVRKSLFDILKPLQCNNFLDLFSGTGIIGFEAASRGVENIIFVDKSIRAQALLRMNSKFFSGVNFEFIRKDSLSFIDSNQKFDIIFADPPYDYPFLDNLIENAFLALNVGGKFILESMKYEFYSNPKRQKKFGDSYISFWENWLLWK